MPSLKPDRDKNFGWSLVFDFGQWWRHVKTIYFLWISLRETLSHELTPKSVYESRVDWLKFEDLSKRDCSGNLNLPTNFHEYWVYLLHLNVLHISRGILLNSSKAEKSRRFDVDEYMKWMSLNCRLNSVHVIALRIELKIVKMFLKRKAWRKFIC